MGLAKLRLTTTLREGRTRLPSSRTSRSQATPPTCASGEPLTISTTSTSTTRRRRLAATTTSLSMTTTRRAWRTQRSQRRIRQAVWRSGGCATIVPDGGKALLLGLAQEPASEPRPVHHRATLFQDSFRNPAFL